ncbi:31010_t:CDS:2, partial [Racocetra persica]
VNGEVEEFWVYNVMNEKSGQKCGQKYKNIGSLTGNLIIHLRDSHRIPLSTVTNEIYKEKMSEFDSFFIILGEKKIRTMIAKSYKYNQENLQNLLTQNIENISLTADFWSSKARHGYLGITATWITPTFEIKNIILENKYIPSLHSSRTISEELYKCIETWNLEDHIISITTNNRHNKLAIGNRLAPAEILVACTKRLIQFFQYQKQIERLEK